MPSTPTWIGCGRTRLLTRTIEWDKNGRNNSFLLRGSDLRTEEEWQARAAIKEPKLTPLQTEYIFASRRTATRRQRVTLGTVTLGLVVAVVLGVLALLARNEAVEQRDKAERQSNIALARQLAAQSELVRNQEGRFLPRSILLAVEAMRRLPSLETDQALRGGLTLLPSPVARLVHHGNAINTEASDALSFDPDGKYLATVGSDGIIRLWDATTGKEIARMNHPGVTQATFGPDGKYLATAGGNYAGVWEVPSGRLVASMKHDDFVSEVAFSPDGEYLATVGGDSIRVWEAATGKEVEHMAGGGADTVAFSPDGKLLASASDKAVRVWEPSSGKEISSMEHEGGVSALAFSPDGEHLATASSDATARVWELPGGREVARVEHEDWVKDVAFSPGGKYLATASVDGTVNVSYWRPEDLIDGACTRLTRNLTREEWQLYLPDEPYRKTCPNLPGPEE